MTEPLVTPGEGLMPRVDVESYRQQASQGLVLPDWFVFQHFPPDERYRRKHRYERTPPTEADWEAYRNALKGLEALEAYEFTDWGGPDYGTEVPEPRSRVKVVFLETEEEWLARCRQLRADEEARA